MGTDRSSGSPWASNLWVIVLAGGQGRRLQGVSRDDRGPVPKQFCALTGSTSMLERSLQRARRLAPRRRTLIVVAAEHRRWWQPILAAYPPANVLVQPQDRGTAAGVLLPVTEVLRRDPEGMVVILPADHQVCREALLRSVILQSVANVRLHPERAVLLGFRPDSRDSDFGWILPRRRPQGRSPVRVQSFHEKPGAERVVRLRRSGAVVSSLILIARAAVLFGLARQALPEVAEPFSARIGSRQATDLAELYRQIPARDLSRELLERCVDSLWVVAAPPCGWSDLGTPERVARSLGETDLRGARKPGKGWAALDLSRLPLFREGPRPKAAP